MLISNISKAYGKHMILNDVSLDIQKGMIVGILGINGSGKSTLLSCLAQNKTLRDGNIIGYVPQEHPLFEELKPIDNIRMWTKLNKKEITAALSYDLLKPLGIADFLNVPVNKMSGGMKKRLAIACALINEPDVILMDEPFASLDLIAKQDVINYVNHFKKNNKAVVIASHDENIFDYCDKIYLLKNTKLYDRTDYKTDKSYIELLRS